MNIQGNNQSQFLFGLLYHARNLSVSKCWPEWIINSYNDHAMRFSDSTSHSADLAGYPMVTRASCGKWPIDFKQSFEGMAYGQKRVYPPVIKRGNGKSTIPRPMALALGLPGGFDRTMP